MGLAVALATCALLFAGSASGGELPTDWEEYPARHVTVHVPSGSARAGEIFAADSDAMMDELLELTGLQSPAARVDAYLAPTRRTFGAIQPGEPPSWAAGTAYPEDGLVFVLLDTRGEKTPRHVFAHELGHVVMYWTFGSNDPPRWLEEGLAQVAAGEFDLQTQAILTRAAVGSGLIPLSSLTHSFPSDPARARIAYAQSRDFVLFVRHRYGEDSVPELVREMAAGTTAELAIERATGASFRDIETAWASRLERRYGWIPVLGGSGAFWGLASVLLVLGWARKRTQKRRKLAAMADAEEAQQARRREHWPPDNEAGPPLWREPEDESRRTLH